MAVSFAFASLSLSASSSFLTGSGGGGGGGGGYSSSSFFSNELAHAVREYRVGFLGIGYHLENSGAGQLIGEELIHAVAHGQNVDRVNLLEFGTHRGEKRRHN